MKRRATRTSLVTEEEIQLTSMIDCIFLLLIFFMVTTVFIDVKGLVIDLPASAQAQEQDQQQKKDVNIQITANGDYVVAGEPVPAAQLASAIRQAMKEANNTSVIIQSDEQAENRFVIYAMDMAKGEKATEMAFAVESAEGQE